jgi:hypothetical protein
MVTELSACTETIEKVGMVAAGWKMASPKAAFHAALPNATIATRLKMLMVNNDRFVCFIETSNFGTH